MSVGLIRHAVVACLSFDSRDGATTAPLTVLAYLHAQRRKSMDMGFSGQSRKGAARKIWSSRLRFDTLRRPSIVWGCQSMRLSHFIQAITDCQVEATLAAAACGEVVRATSASRNGASGDVTERYICTRVVPWADGALSRCFGDQRP